MKWVFKDNAPIYLQIVSGLQRAIVNGTYPPGYRLPSVRELALEAGVNPNTMQRAMAELERTGIVYSVRTSGRFVTEEESILQKLREDMSSEIVADFFQALHGIGMSDADILEAVRHRASASAEIPSVPEQ